MADGNGRAQGGMMTPPSGTAEFVIGGQSIAVPALSFAALRKARDDIDAIEAGMNWIDYAYHVMRIVACALDGRDDMTEEYLSRNLSIPEMRGLSDSMDALLLASGFSMPGEVVATREDLGTGTSTPSSPNSPPEESAPATGTGSSDLIPFGDTSS